VDQDDVLEIRRRPLGYRIVLWLFVAFSAAILIISRTQPALAADMKGHHGPGKSAPASQQADQGHNQAGGAQGKGGGASTQPAAQPASSPASSDHGSSGKQDPGKSTNSGASGTPAARIDHPSDQHAAHMSEENDPCSSP